MELQNQTIFANDTFGADINLSGTQIENGVPNKSISEPKKGNLNPNKSGTAHNFSNPNIDVDLDFFELETNSKIEDGIVNTHASTSTTSDYLCGHCLSPCGPENGSMCAKCVENVFEGIPIYTPKPVKPSTHPRDGATNFDEDETEGGRCVVCLEKSKSHVLVPCGHYAFCQDCVKPLKNCALCRKRIAKKVKVFEP